MKVTNITRAALSTLVTGLALSLPALADVKLHSLFTDDMVLQREKPVLVWGTASAKEKVTVSIAGQSQSTLADADGNWCVTLTPLQIATEQTLTVKGNNEIVLKNIAIGDVYLCSGQSNMAFGVDFFNNPGEEQANANYPDIRLFTVPLKNHYTAQREFGAPAQWKVCTPANTLNFSATAYYFGRDLHKQLGIPIGLIASAWGGTPIQAWVSRDTLVKRDDMREATLQTEADLAELAQGTTAQRMLKWWQNSDLGFKNKWTQPNFDDSTWKTVAMPAPMSKTEIGDYSGAVWFRKQIEIPAAWAGKELRLYLGKMGDRDATLFNGEVVGDTGMYVWYQERDYKIPAALVKAGRATIAVGVLPMGTGDKAGLIGPDNPGDMRIEVVGEPAQKINLAGDWKYHLSQLTKDTATPPRWIIDYSRDASPPTVLYNGMIAPLVPFAFRGMVWYQGESDVNNPTRYRTLLPDLIRDWRAHWNLKAGEELPFYVVQLPNYAPSEAEARPNSWAEMRDAQAQALKLARVQMVTTIDIGDATNIHPGNKQDVGKRLALVALATDYGKPLEYSGPMLKEMKIEGNKVRLTFSHADGLKTSDGAAPLGFMLQGEDGQWHAATARIEGESIVLHSDGVLAPKAVRYAFENNPKVNLTNAAGLPAVPFRTDAVQ
jgi:sialate O-acetylesterase